jgi:hypothetical protein
MKLIRAAKVNARALMDAKDAAYVEAEKSENLSECDWAGRRLAYGEGTPTDAGYFRGAGTSIDH